MGKFLARSQGTNENGRLMEELKGVHMVYMLRFFLLISVFASAAWGQDVMTPPVDIVHDGIPPVPASIGADAYLYRSYSNWSLVGWDPAKPEPIVIGPRADSIQAGVIQNPGGPPQFFTRLPAGYSEIYSEPGGKYFLYAKDAGKYSQSQIYRYDIDTQSSTLLTDGTSRNRYPIWSNSGKLIAYSSARRDGIDLDIYIMDPLDPNSSRMVTEVKGEDWAPFAWSPDDSRLILSDYRSSDETYLWVLDLGSGKRILLTPAKGGQKAFNGSYAYFSKDGKGIYLSTDRSSEFRRLAYLDLVTGKTRFLTESIPWDVDEFALSPDGKALAFIANEDGISRLHVMDTGTSRELPVPDLPGTGIVVPGSTASVVPGLRWHRSLPCLGFVFNSTKDPAEVLSLNIATGKLDRWATATKAAQSKELREPELIKWKSFDGRMISGYLYRPPDSFTGKRPVIISIHGGLSDQFRPDFRGGDNYFVNALGIAMIYPNVRGSSGFGKTFSSLDDGLRRVDASRDVGALLEWIAGRSDLDPGRVILQGESYGGYLALSAAGMYSDKVCGVISYVAPTNLATFIERNDKNDQATWRREIGDERDKKTREFLDRIAPVNNADKITKAAFLIIGGKDGVVSVTETQRIVSKLKDNRVPVWYLLAKNEGHGFADARDFEYAFDAEVVFIERFLSADSSGGGPAGPPRTPNAVSIPAQMPTVDEVLDKYIQALGGRATLLRIRSSLSKGTLEVPAMGVRADFEYWREAPDKFASEVVISDSVASRTGFDGVTGWSESIGAGTKLLEGEELSRIKREADFYPSLHLKDLYPKMALTGMEKVGGTDAFVIDATRFDGKPAKLFFDVGTGLLLRTDYIAPTDVHEYLSDYREVDGTKVPFTTRLVTKTLVRINKLKEITNNVEIDESKFTKPKVGN